jgi:imidazole glycerol-phosphate synthase subunit HisH
MAAPQKVALLDLGMGNLRSVERSLLDAGVSVSAPVEVTITADPAIVLAADRVVLPGQGAFRDGSRALRSPLGDAVRAVLAKKTPFLGICLGLQLLFDSSDEAPGEPGLGIFRGHNERLRAETKAGPRVKIPHMGWNELELTERAPPAITKAGRWFYFVHSFHAVADDPSLVVATVTHGDNRVTAAIARDNVIATQFHPEKSQDAGLSVLAGWLAGGE